MSKIITDQYSDRTDLTGYQKWRLRNPEKYREIHAQAQRLYRLLHPDRADTSVKKYRKRIRLEKIEKSQAYTRDKILKSKDNMSLGRRAEIFHHHSRGRDAARIAIWMNIPISVVNEVLKTPAT